MDAGRGRMAGSSRCSRKQSGAALVEFAFVFPILFLLVYGVIVYAYIYVLKQSIVYAAQEAAEAAVAVDPAIDDAFAQQQSVVRATAVAALSWLPESQQARVVGTGGERVEVALCPMGTQDCPTDSDALRVTLRFDLVNPSSLFPVLNLYIVGSVPPLPATLTASAVVRI